MNSDFSKLSKEDRELRLTALALGELAPAEAEEINQAIAADAELGREFARLKQTVELVRETAAMDRRISPEGTPLRLDDTRRQKLLEAFKTPAPRATKPHRRKKLWFVPMSAAAAIVGLLIAAMAFPHMRGVRRLETITMLSLKSSDGAFAEESVSRRLLERLFDQPSAQADLEGRPQDTVALAAFAPETPAPNPEPLARGTKSLAIALPTAGDKDGDGLAEFGRRYSERRDDFGTTRKPAEALNEFSMLSDLVVRQQIAVEREATGVKGVESARSGALAAPAITTASGRQASIPGIDGRNIVTDLDTDVKKTSPPGENLFVGRDAYLGAEGKAEGIAGNTRSPQQTPPVSSITLSEVMHNPIPETAPTLVQSDGRIDNSSVTVNFSETKSLVSTLQREENAPVGSRPFGEATWRGILDRPVATTAPATPPPANAPEQAGATVYSLNAVGYVDLGLKSSGGGGVTANPIPDKSDSVEAFKAGDAVVNFTKEAKPESGLNVHWDINGIAAQENGLSRPNDRSLGVTPSTQPDSQPLLENSASAGGGLFYRFRLTEPDPGRLALNNNGNGTARRAVPIFKIQSGETVANGTTESYTNLDRNRSFAEATKEPAWSGYTPQDFRSGRNIGGQAGAGPTPGGGGGGSGGGRANRTSGISAGGFFGGNAGQPAQPDAQIANGDIDSLSTAGGIAGTTLPQQTINAKVAEVNQDGSRESGFDSPRGYRALNGQILDQDRAVPSANLTAIYHDYFMDGDLGATTRSDDGAVRYLNGTEVARTDALVSNNSWGLPADNTSAFITSYFRTDGREKLPSGTDTFALGDQVSKDEKPVSVDYDVSAGSIVVANGSFTVTNATMHSLTLADQTVSSFAEFPATAGGKTFAASHSGLGGGLGAQGPANVGTFGVAQSQPGGGSGVGGFGRGGLNRLNSAVRRSGGANGTDATMRGFYEFGTASTGDQTERLVNGAVRGFEIQLPAQANEESRQGSPTRPRNERTTAHFFGPRNQVGVDAAGLPIADVEAKVKKLDQVALRGEGIVTEDRLESRVQAPTKETDVDQALADYAQLTGKTMLKSPQVQTKAKISIPNLEQLSEVERATALAKVLGENQIALIPDGEKSLKVVPQGNVAQEATPFSTNAHDNLRDTQGVPGAQMIPLKHLTPEDAISILTPYSKLPQALSTVKGSQVLVVRDYAENVKRMTEILARVDVPLPAVRSEPEAAKRPSAPAPTPQPEVLARDNAFSTFSLNVSDVSFKLAAASLEKGAMPEVANIRSEEFINAFDYRDPMPAPGAPLAFAWERARYPFAHNRDVVRFSVKTAAQGREAGKPLNIVLLLDNSGSMERADRVRIIQESLRTLAAQLKPQDKLSVVTFSRTARLWADGVTGAQAAEVANKIGTLTPEGGTNLEDALDLAYKTALRHYLAAAVNRVVLLTDGAANLGNVEPKELKAKVEGFRKQGIALDCFGIGWEGFNDDLLEQLSRNGDGRYGFVNTPEEAASEFVGQLAGALRVAASDVKMQVEFNPKRVTTWRQIGYAKHQLTKQQFRDNKVDAAEIGAAESGNALYIIETNPNGQGPIATVRARFRVPQTSDYREHEWIVPFGSAVELEQSSPSLRLASSASAFSEWLASSPFAGDVSTDRLLKIVSGVPEIYGADPRPKKLEWMIRQAKSISGK